MTPMMLQHKTLAGSVLALMAVGSGLWLWQATPKAKASTHPGLVYTSAGFGGYVPAARGKASVPVSLEEKLLKEATAAYLAGRYAECESQAQKLVRPVSAEPGPQQRQATLQAELLLAYSAAHRKDFSLSQERFAALRDEAASLPDHGARKQVLGEVTPSFEEEAAFEHAVCTGVLQGQEAAEAEYKRFLCRYPTSILLHAAIKRIARYHGGDVPKDARKLWQQAMHIQKQQEQAKQREASLCAPECLAELLRRRGQKADVPALAKEMTTSEQGTSLASLSAVSKRHGVAGQGLELTPKGLAEQKLPVVALTTSGHFVLVEKLDSAQVSVWDPDLQGPGKSGRHAYSLNEWQQIWQGITLTVQE